MNRTLPKRRPFLFIAILTLFIFNASLLLAGQYQVTRVFDGNTIKAAGGKQKLTIRLVGIDAPETSQSKNDTGQPFSQRSKKHLASIVLKQAVDIKLYGRDIYGRLLGEIFLNGRNVNLEMVKAGLAEVYRGTPPKEQNMKPYWKAEHEAKMAKRGMWVQGDKYVSPREWRKAHQN